MLPSYQLKESQSQSSLQINSIIGRLQTRELQLFQRLVEAIKNNDTSSTILAVEIQKIRNLVRKLHMIQSMFGYLQNTQEYSKNQQNLEVK